MVYSLIFCYAVLIVPIPEGEKKKIALFCNIPEECVIEGLDVKSIYQVPIKYHDEGFDVQILKRFNLPYEDQPNLSKWDNLVKEDLSAEGEVNIALVGKYTGLSDAYKSLTEALHHAGMANGVKVKVHWINSRSFLRDGASKKLQQMHGILVPGGFGHDGVQGKIAAAKFARENKFPYFGICLGMQVAVIEAARNLAGIEDANSSEFAENGDSNNVIGLMTEWSRGDKTETRKKSDDLGGTMRLGAYDCSLKAGSLIHKIYGSQKISERHRHRYEVNINYQETLEKAGLVFSGFSPNGKLPETVEYNDHPWFVGVQFHPEFKSRPFNPHPLFKEFVAAALKHKNR